METPHTEHVTSVLVTGIVTSAIIHRTLTDSELEYLNKPLRHPVKAPIVLIQLPEPEIVSPTEVSCEHCYTHAVDTIT